MAKDQDEKKDLSNDDDLIQQALDHWKEACDADTQYELRKQDLKFALGDSDNNWQWPADIVNARAANGGSGSRPSLTINKIPQHLRQVTNEQRKNKPSVKVRPTNDDADNDVAEVYGGMIRHIEDVSSAQTAYTTAGEHQVSHGLGFIRVVTQYEDDDSFDQEIRIERVKNPFKVRMDPFVTTPEGSDARYGFIVEEIPVEEFKRQHPGKVASSFEGAAEGWFSNENVRVAEYLYCDYKKRTLVKMMTGQDCFLDTLPDDTPPLAFTYKAGKRLEREVDVRQWKWCLMTAAEVLERRDFPCKYIPLVRVVGEEWEVDGEIIIKGLVRNAKDPQRMINYWTSSEAEYVALQPKAPYILDARQVEGYEGEWAQANTANKPYLLYNGVVEMGTALPKPQREPPPQSSQGFMEGKLAAGDDLQATMGQYNGSVGVSKNDQSGKALQQQAQESDTGTYHYLDNLAKAVCQIGRICLDMIPKVYDAKTIVRVLGEDGDTDFAAFDWKQTEAVKTVQQPDGSSKKVYNPKVGKYDVTVTTGPSYTTKRQESQEFFTQLAQADPTLMAKAGDIIMSSFDVPGAEKIGDRLKLFLPPEVLQAEETDDQDPKMQLQQAKAMIKQLEQGVQQGGQLYQDAQRKLQEAGQQMAQMDAEKKGRQLETQAKVHISEQDNATKIAVAQIGAKLEAQSAQMQADLEAFIAKLEGSQNVATAAITAHGQEAAAMHAADAQTQAAQFASQGQVGAAQHSAQGAIGAAQENAKAVKAKPAAKPKAKK